MLFTYKDLPDKDLQSYLDFSSSDVGVKYHSTMMKGLNKAFIDAGEKFGNEMMRELEQQKNKHKT
jgi:hypothetical protein